jgi:response regulator RpfG family c-di-GMP phosphodiesterase
LRETDIVCRYGGDEIVVALPDTNAQETRATAERILELVRRHKFGNGKDDLSITVSVGAAFREVTAGEAVGTVLVKADHALHRAKKEGRNRAAFWEGNAAGPPEDAPRQGMDATSSVSPTRLGRVLLVDDEPSILNIFQRVLKQAGYDVVLHASAAQARASMARERGRFDIALLDLHLPERNGLELLKELRAIDETLVGILITGRATMDHVVNALRSGAFDFIIKPIGTAQLLAVMERAVGYRRLLLANRHYQLHLEEMVQEKSGALLQAVTQLRHAKNSTLEILCAMLDAREHPAGMHGKRVARMACQLAKAMAVPDEQVAVIKQAAMLHDIGKIAVPDAILLKESALTEEEWRLIRNHPQIGFSILAANPDLERTAEIVLAHQERYDGSGYPQGLKGDAICLGARIFAVVDGYDAMRMGRPYASSRDAAESLMEIKRCSGTQFDPAVVEAFERCHAEIESVAAVCS